VEKNMAVMDSFFKVVRVWFRSLPFWGGASYLDRLRERVAGERVRMYFEQLDQSAAAQGAAPVRKGLLSCSLVASWLGGRW
jgi:hypothetical protein